MTDYIHLENFSWWPGVLPVLAWLALLTLEISRGNKQYLVSRLLAVTLLMSALAAILWVPAVPQQAQRDSVMVVGEQSQESVLDSIRRELPGIRVIHNDTLFERLDNQRVILTGQGIPEYDAWKVAGSSLELITRATPPGISKFYPPRTVVRGDTAIWQGYINIPAISQLKLVWQSRVVDSVRLDNPGWFTLRHIPPAAGPLVYHIVAESGDSVRRWRTGIEVRESGLNRAGIFQSYPTFEIRSLKEYLAASGMAVLVRQTISKDKFSYEYLNTERERISLTPDFLASLDIVVLDQMFLEIMSAGQRRNLENAIRSGLGLLILPGQERSGLGQMELPVIRTENGLVLKSSGRIRSVYETEGEIRAGGKRMGRGMITTSLMTQTYTWKLEGRNEDYAGYWSALIRSTLRRQEEYVDRKEWLLRKDIPGKLTIYSSGIPEVFWNGVNLPPKQDVYLDNRWQVDVWPADTGWHRLTVNGDTSLHYVYSEPEWPSVRYEQQKRMLGKITPESGEGTVKRVLKPLPPWYFYLVSVISLAWLWTEPKIHRKGAWFSRP